MIKNKRLSKALLDSIWNSSGCLSDVPGPVVRDLVSALRRSYDIIDRMKDAMIEHQKNCKACYGIGVGRDWAAEHDELVQTGKSTPLIWECSNCGWTIKLLEEIGE